MPTNGREIYLTELEVKIMSVFTSYLYLTDTEMAKELRVLADKLDGLWRREEVI